MRGSTRADFVETSMAQRKQREPEGDFGIVEALCEYQRNPLGIDVTAPRFSWILRHTGRGQRQSAYRIRVASTLSRLESGRADLWDSGRIRSAQSVNVPYGGRALRSGTAYHWNVCAWDRGGRRRAQGETASFEMGLLHARNWRTGWFGCSGATSGEGVLFRREFAFPGEVTRARVYISGLGYYELSINGRKVGDHVLDPGWTEYSKTALYVTYDIAPYLMQGTNAVGVMLGSGWHGEPLLLLQMDIALADGSHVVLQDAEGSWQTTGAPVVRNSIYGGEVYDARLELPGWDMPGFRTDPRVWANARRVEGPGGKLKAQMLEAIKVVRTVKPVRITRPQPGVHIVDFGQNFSGWCRLSVQGPRGTSVVMRHAEVLSADGTVNQENLRTARATAVYVLKGGGGETYEPRFTYFGFRYVEVTGFPGELTPEDLTGCVVRSSVDTSGEFSCSNALFNRIQSNIVWTEGNNLHSLPTDCPQRDERMGWLNDMTVRAEEAIYNFSMVRLYTKWMRDIRDAQDPVTGAIADTAPFLWGGRPGDPVDCYLFVAWFLYLYYGDARILEEYYDSMKRWVDFLGRQADDLIVPYTRYGDWCTPIKDCLPADTSDIPEESRGAVVRLGSYPRATPGALISTAYYHYNALILSRIAERTGNGRDSRRYAALARRIASALNKRFFDPDTGNYATGSQGSNTLPLFLGIVPRQQRHLVLRNIVQDIVEKHGGHLNAGNQCTKYMFEVLTELGAGDVAYGMMNRTTYPSWGYMIEHGATTIWERWEELTGPGMNSHDHPMLGAVGAWFYKYLAGLQADPRSPGWQSFQVRPHVLSDLGSVTATIRTVRGRISVAWERKPGQLTLDVCVPVNSSARIHIPLLGSTHAQVSEGDTPLWDGTKGSEGIAGLRRVRQVDGYLAVDAGSGSYHFAVRAHEPVKPQ